MVLETEDYTPDSHCRAKGGVSGDWDRCCMAGYSVTNVLVTKN